MNISGTQSTIASEKLNSYSFDMIIKEVSQLYKFVENSLSSYQMEFYEYLVPILMGTINYLLKRFPGETNRIRQLFKKYCVHHLTFHEQTMESARTDIEKVHSSYNSQNPDGRNQTYMDDKQQFISMTTPMRKATRKVLYSYLCESASYFILDIENRYVTFNIIEDSVDDVEFLHSNLSYYINIQKKQSNALNRKALSSELPKISSSAKRYPSIAVATFTSRFDSHIICIRMSNDGKNFAASTDNGIVHLWCETPEKKIAHHLLLGHTENVMDMDFSKDGNYLLTGGLDGSVKLWLTQEGRCLVNYRTFAQPIWFVRFNPTNRIFMVVYYNAILQFFTTEDIQEVFHIQAKFGDITAVAWTSQSHYFIGYSTGSIIFNKEKSFNQVLLGSGSPPSAMITMNKLNYLIVGYEDGGLAVYSLVNDKQLAILKAHDKVIRKILYNLEMNTITTISEDGYVKIWEFRVVDKDDPKADKLGFYSFHEEQQPQKESTYTYSLFLLRQYSIAGMEFIEGVMMKDNVMVVAGITNNDKLN